MAEYNDYVGGGILPLRHESPDFQLPARVVLYGARVGGRDEGFGEGLDEIGRVQGEDALNGDEETHGDLLGAGLWQVNRSGGTRTGGSAGGASREIPGWSFAWAAVTSGKPRITVRATGEDAFAKSNGTDGSRGSPANVPGKGGGGKGASPASGGSAKSEDEVFHVKDKPGWEEYAEKGWDRKLAEHFGEADAGPPSASPAGAPTTRSREAPSTQAKGVEAGKLGITEALPIHYRLWDKDERFRPKKTVALPPGVDLLPKGVGGVVLTATHEQRPQQDVLLPAGFGPLVATHFGGRALLSSPVFDIKDEDELDKIRKGRLHTLMRVYEIPKTCNQGLFGEPREHALALQLGRPRGGLGGRVVFADQGEGTSSGGPAEVLAASSKAAGGPLDVGAAGDKHLHGFNSDGEPMTSLHISTNALFRMNAAYDAPLKFGGEWVDPDNIGSKWNEVYLRYDKNTQHPWVCGSREGMWRWQVLVPYFIPGDGGTPPFETFDTTTPTTEPPFGPFETFPVPEDTTPFETFDTVPPITPGIPWIPEEEIPKIPSEFVPEWEFTAGDGENDPCNVITDYVEITDAPAYVHPCPPATTTGQGGTWTPGRVVPPGSFVDVTGNQKIKAETLKGYSFTSPADRQTARLNPRALSGLTFWNELSMPGIAFRPQHFGLGAWDIRYAPNPSEKQVHDYGHATPVVGRIEVIGNQVGPGFEHTTLPGRGRYTGGTASGSVNVLPPEIGAENIIDGTEPAVTSDFIFNFYKTGVGLGKPNAEGGVEDGFVISRSADGSTLTFDGFDSTGAVDADIPLEIDRDTQEVRAFGVTLGGGGGGGEETPGWAGCGGDGAFDLDGTNTYASFFSKSGSTYTQLADVAATTFEVQGGVTLLTKNYRIYAKESFTNAGTISNNGVAGDVGVLGLGGAGATAGSCGGTGGSGGANGSNGSIAVPNTSCVGGNGGNGTNAGSGGSAGTGGNGSGGFNNVRGTYRHFLTASTGCFFGGSLGSNSPVAGGSGGGGGSNAAATKAGGGGGGGIIVIASPDITNSGTIQANGGAGGNPGTDDGGGGGGGGVVFLCYQDYTNTGTVQAAGGAAGSASATAGADGKVVECTPP